MCYISFGMRDPLLLTIFDSDDTTGLVNKAAYSITISVYEYYLQTGLLRICLLCQTLMFRLLGLIFSCFP